MTQNSEKSDSDIKSDREQKIYNNPFAKRFNTKMDRAPIEDYIKSWIEDIFYYNKKIDIQAKATIYRKLISEKFYELSSCSIVYSIIREKIKEICFRLRKFINHSFETLHGQLRYLCNIAQTPSIDRKKNSIKDKNDQQDMRNINLPLSKVYVISYRYMCQVAKETFNFWKILYECTQVKDLRFNSLQSSLNEFILETYVQANQSFEPRIMLQSMSFPQKCKFIYAEVEGIKKRIELTSFYEDETAKKLFVKKQDRKDGIIEQELAKMRYEFQRPEQKLSFSRKYEMFFHKPRMDYKDIQHLRKYYLQNDENNEEALFNNLFASINHDPSTQERELGFSQEKLDLIKSLERNNEKLFEIEDASSQDDIHDNRIYYEENDIDSREELIDEQDNIEIQLSMNPQKLVENRETQGSTKSQPAEEMGQSQDLPMKNYENEPPPPEFIMPENITREEQDQFIRQKERTQMRRAIELLTQYSHERTSKEESEQEEEEPHEQKMAKLKINIAKSKEIRLKEKKIEFLDKKQLEEQKQKLEKYRKELEKEKEQLLREVQKFMKEKKKETNLLALIKENKYKYKFSRSNYKCGINHKIIHKLEKHQQKIESITLKYDLNGFEDDISESEPSIDPAISEIMEDKNKMKEIEQAIAKDLMDDPSKLSKKQQKLKKKQEHEASLIGPESSADKGIKLESKKSERSSFTEQEANLNNFLERLQIDDCRIPCNVEQKQLAKWKTRANDYRRGQPLKIEPPPTKAKETVVSETVHPPKKKKKNRR